MDSTKTKTVGLEGPATIYEVAGLKEAFREALAEGGNLRVELDESTKWDLAGLQLLVSCVKTAQAEGRRLTLAKVPRACVEAAERAGLSAWLESATEHD
ncbi:STAS domain-containing protein [Paludisphaera rhizosphaerae]|uniref:STAS domain-containing protein n=1 Tax=Paludisphaera rhizosphaerae TaxID=2711216 RepID=UPI0013EC0E6C|nr:STAS domain-containing protein [Paludisphaera rhizosphaerae]